MIKTKFNNVGSVRHGIRGLIQNHRISAWYDPQGSLIDAEAFHEQTRRGRYIKPGGPVWRALERIGGVK